MQNMTLLFYHYLKLSHLNNSCTCTWCAWLIIITTFVLFFPATWVIISAWSVWYGPRTVQSLSWLVHNVISTFRIHYNHQEIKVRTLQASFNNVMHMANEFIYKVLWNIPSSLQIWFPKFWKLVCFHVSKYWLFL